MTMVVGELKQDNTGCVIGQSVRFCSDDVEKACPTAGNMRRYSVISLTKAPPPRPVMPALPQ